MNTRIKIDKSTFLALLKLNYDLPIVNGQKNGHGPERKSLATFTHTCKRIQTQSVVRDS